MQKIFSKSCCLCKTPWYIHNERNIDSSILLCFAVPVISFIFQYMMREFWHPYLFYHPEQMYNISFQTFSIEVLSFCMSLNLHNKMLIQCWNTCYSLMKGKGKKKNLNERKIKVIFLTYISLWKKLSIKPSFIAS